MTGFFVNLSRPRRKKDATRRASTAGPSGGSATDSASAMGSPETEARRLLATGSAAATQRAGTGSRGGGYDDGVFSTVRRSSVGSSRQPSSLQPLSGLRRTSGMFDPSILDFSLVGDAGDGGGAFGGGGDTPQGDGELRPPAAAGGPPAWVAVGVEPTPRPAPVVPPASSAHGGGGGASQADAAVTSMFSFADDAEMRSAAASGGGARGPAVNAAGELVHLPMSPGVRMPRLSLPASPAARPAPPADGDTPNAATATSTPAVEGEGEGEVEGDEDGDTFRSSLVEAAAREVGLPVAHMEDFEGVEHVGADIKWQHVPEASEGEMEAALQQLTRLSTLLGVAAVGVGGAAGSALTGVAEAHEEG
jgi:hypothetical protein